MAVTERKATRREQIISIASSLFREHGYKASSMRLLAEKMGMEAASLYNHIASKDDVLQEICFAVASDYLSYLKEIEASPVTAAEKLESIIRFQIKMMLEKFEPVYVSQRDWKHLPAEQLEKFLQQRRDYETRFAAIIEAGIAAGQFKKINPYVAVLGILSAIRGIEFWQRQPKNISAAMLETDMLNLLMGGLLAQ